MTITTRISFPSYLLLHLFCLLFFCSCSSGGAKPILEQWRKIGTNNLSTLEMISGDFVFARPGKFDSFDSIAAEYLGDARKGWLISKFNNESKIVPGKIIIVPLKPFYLGGIGEEGYQTVPILAYHCFSEERSDKMTVKAEEFERQMLYMKKNGFETISLDRLMEFMEFEAPIPEKAFLLTIDDGWKSSYRIAFPILKKYGFKASFFIYTDIIGNAKGLEWRQLKEMANFGFEIQNHTRSHRNLTIMEKGEDREQYLEAVVKEITDAEKAIEMHIGVKSRYFAYPYGKTNELIASILEKLGYRAAFTVERGSSPFFVDRYKIRRSVIYGDYDLNEFAKNVSFWEAYSTNEF